MTAFVAVIPANAMETARFQDSGCVVSFGADFRIHRPLLRTSFLIHFAPPYCRHGILAILNSGVVTSASPILGECVEAQQFWHNRGHHIHQQYTAAVSIHSHTSRSRESLGFVERSFTSNALLRAFIERQNLIAQRHGGVSVDLRRAYWIPPLCPQSAYRLERDQIEQELGLKAMVSLSDHDSIEAPQLLCVTISDLPISFEWTVPFRTSKFHLGVHNLPAARAQRWTDDLQACTRSGSVGQVCDLLRALHAEPDVLVVFNHPLWNLRRNPSML
jgi:hypothetical protein